MSLHTCLSCGERFPSEPSLLDHADDAHAPGGGRSWTKIAPRKAASSCDHEYASFGIVGDHEDLVCDTCHTILDPADYEDADADPEEKPGSGGHQVWTPPEERTVGTASGGASDGDDQVSRIAALEAEVARLNKAKRIAELEERVARLRADLEGPGRPDSVSKTA